MQSGFSDTKKQSERFPAEQCCHRVAILIVGFRNPNDIKQCLAALSLAKSEPSFDVFICENGGSLWFQQLIDELTDTQGPCVELLADLTPSICQTSERLVKVKSLALRGRDSRVWIACAKENLGYAGGINVWLERLMHVGGWEGVWVLNPDTEPDPNALAALVERATTGNKGMVGSTVVSLADRDLVLCRGGLHWRKWMSRPALIGFGEAADEVYDVAAVEGVMDAVSGSSTYVTRRCLDKIGLMDERYFLYYEDMDWAMRAKHYGLGYAGASIVPHKHGSTVGSAPSRAKQSAFSVYLENRNRIQFVRSHFPFLLPLAAALSFCYCVEYLFVRSPANFKAAVQGVFSGLSGETGVPPIAKLEDLGLAISFSTRDGDPSHEISKRVNFARNPTNEQST